MTGRVQGEIMTGDLAVRQVSSSGGGLRRARVCWGGLVGLFALNLASDVALRVDGLGVAALPLLFAVLGLLSCRPFGAGRPGARTVPAAAGVLLVLTELSGVVGTLVAGAPPAVVVFTVAGALLVVALVGAGLAFVHGTGSDR